MSKRSEERKRKKALRRLHGRNRELKKLIAEQKWDQEHPNSPDKRPNRRRSRDIWDRRRRTKGPGFSKK